MSLICIPIQARSFAELRKKIVAAPKEADILEIWIDHLKQPVDPKKIMALSTKPLLIVNKGKKDGGLWTGSEQEKLATLKKYLDAGVAYVDVNLESDPKLLKKFLGSRAGKTGKHGSKKTRIILSHHNFTTTPSPQKLWLLAQKGFRLGADIVKIVTTAREPRDNLATLSLLARAQKQKKKLIAFCMGPLGKVSRLLAADANSYIIYLAPNARSRTAPGQLTVAEYKKHKKYKLNLL